MESQECQRVLNVCDDAECRHAMNRSDAVLRNRSPFHPTRISFKPLFPCRFPFFFLLQPKNECPLPIAHRLMLTNSNSEPKTNTQNKIGWNRIPSLRFLFVNQNNFFTITTSFYQPNVKWDIASYSGFRNICVWEPTKPHTDRRMTGGNGITIVVKTCSNQVWLYP